MDTPKILSVQALENKKLLVTFVNGVEKIYDCNPLLSMEMFEVLKNNAFFRSVKVDFVAKTATVVFDPSAASLSEIAAASTNAGYPAKPAG